MRKIVVAAFILSFLVMIFYIFLHYNKKEKIANEKYKIQFAYSPISLNPTEYGDLASVFIGNHIYYRLLPEEGRPGIPHVANNVIVECLDSKKELDPECKWMRISFTPVPFSDCLGRIYTPSDIKNEFESLLDHATWTFPGWKKCVGKKDEVCVISPYYPDPYRRLQDFAFRFGWSKSNKNDRSFGAGPYCLFANEKQGDVLKSGILVPRHAADNLPKIEYNTSQKKEDEFDIALYGSLDLLTKDRINLQNHTPIIYYLVTNINLSPYKLPWNTLKTKKLIRDYMISTGVLFPQDEQLENIAPAGKAINNEKKINIPKNKTFKLALPDYLPNCKYFADLLNKNWDKEDKIEAYCTDIVTYVISHVWSKKRDWDAFLVYVSPSSPSRHVIKDNFFSTFSNQSWTYEHSNPEELYYRMGFGQALTTVNKNKICGLRPDPSGFGDFFITDVITCDD